MGQAEVFDWVVDESEGESQTRLVRLGEMLGEMWGKMVGGLLYLLCSGVFLGGCRS